MSSEIFICYDHAEVFVQPEPDWRGRIPRRGGYMHQYELTPKFLHWMEEVLACHWWSERAMDGLWFQFKTRSQAAIFKLTWA